MEKPRLISVIITTYNRLDALMLVLKALDEQNDVNFEVIIADDGSRIETKEAILDVSKKYRYPLAHVWQEDTGFRAAAIRNKATAQCSGDYVIYLDGDCVPLPTFIQRHARLAESGYFVAGNRVLLSKNYTPHVLSAQLPIFRFEWWQWMRARRLGRINRLLPLLTLPGQRWRKYTPNKWFGVKTCNLGVWKHDLLAVNGLDEQYTGWGYEDSDLVIRLIRQGIHYKSGKFAAPVLHCWHEENDRSQEADNLKRLASIQKSENIRALCGIDQYL